MTITAPARPDRPQGLPAALRAAVALAVVLTVITVGLAGLFATAASARTLRRPETRVGAFGLAAGQTVGDHEPVLAGQRRARAPSYDRMAVGSCVAAETEPALSAGSDSAATQARGGVYSLQDEAGDVVRTGRTNDLAARALAHARDPVLGDFEFQVEYRTDVYAEQRGLEQTLYDQYPGAQSENGGFNKIRGISPSNPNLPTYMQAAQDFLEGLGS